MIIETEFICGKHEGENYVNYYFNYGSICEWRTLRRHNRIYSDDNSKL